MRKHQRSRSNTWRKPKQYLEAELAKPKQHLEEAEATPGGRTCNHLRALFLEMMRFIISGEAIVKVNVWLPATRRGTGKMDWKN